MKKLLRLCGFALLLPCASCERKCDSYTIAPIRGSVEDYFGVYKPGNWWVYQNKDGTKKDSVYITDFSDVPYKNKTTCVESEERDFILRNSVLMNGNNLYVLYSSSRVSVGINFSLVKDQAQSGGFPQFRYDEDLNKLSSFPEPDNQGNNLLDSLRLNHTTYYNVLKGAYSNNTYYFSKGKGLAGWVVNNETFNLVSYKIQ